MELPAEPEAERRPAGAAARSLFARATAAHRYGGLRYAAGRALRGNWAATYALYWRDVSLEDTRAGEQARGTAETVTCTLREDEVDAYLEFRPTTHRAEALRRIAAGHVCRTIRTRERIISAVWLREDVIWLPVVKRSIALERCEAYAYDSFTDPASRRSGVAQRRKIAVDEHLRERGITRLFTYVRSENMPSIRSVESSGYVAAGRISFVRLGPRSAVIRSWEDDSLRGRPMERAPGEYPAPAVGP